MKTYVIEDWRENEKELDYCGDPVVEALVTGYGWCRFSRRLSAVWIKRAYRTNWEHAEDHEVV